MTDNFKWVKLFLENWKTVLAIYMFLSGVASYNAINSYEKTELLDATYKQVAAVANHNYQLKTPSVTNIKVIKSSCDGCKSSVDDHVTEHH